MSEPPTTAETPTSRANDTDAEKLVGETLSEKYRLDEHIGGGGMGEVYRAEHVMMKKTVAVKVLRPEVVHHENVVERFRREAQAAANIDHPNVCGATDFGKTDDGDFYLVMEFLDGETLSERLAREGTVSADEAIAIGDAIAAALERAHELGIVHRDLKPDNVMLLSRPGEDRALKVLDFGVSRVQMAEDTPSITQTGAIFGTPQYMSPEQTSGEEVDLRADLYALGALLYELVAGRPVFQAEESVRVMAAHLEEPVVPPSQVEGAIAIPPDLERVILELLEKDPADRPQSATDVRGRLSQIEVPATAETGTAAGGGKRRDSFQVQVPTGKWVEQVKDRLDLTTVAAIGAFFVACGILAGVILLYAVNPAAPRSLEAVHAQLTEQRQSFVDKAGIGEAVERLEGDTPRRAAEHLTSTPETANGNPHFEYLLGNARARSGQWEKALDHYGRAVEKEGDYIVDPTLLSDVVYTLGARDEALAKRAEAILAPHLSRTVVRQALAETTWTANAKRTREEALALLEKHEILPELETWRRASVRLRHGDGCDDYEKALEQLVALEDPRALEALRAMEDVPRRGCGALNLRDCYKCVRDDIDDAIETLEKFE